MNFMKIKGEQIENFKFGILLFFVFTFMAIYFLGSRPFFSVAFSFLATFCFVLARFKPSFFAPFLRVWLAFGEAIGKVVSPITLAFIFFLMLTPMAFFSRMIGRDELRLKRRKCSTYWIIRAESQVSKDSFKNQY